MVRMKNPLMAGMCIFFFAFSSCISKGPVEPTYDYDDDFTIANLRNMNQQNLTRLKAEMTKRQVSKIMGSRSAEETVINGTFTVTNPYKSEIFEPANQNTIVVDYYLTEYIPVGGASMIPGGSAPPKILDQHLTPLVFVNDKLVGWGRKFFIEYRSKNDLKSRKVIYGNP